jgi:hypothetical protein
VVIYLINDVHYYLLGWKPYEKSTVYTSGGMFAQIPGTYTLPGGDGKYIVSYTPRNAAGWNGGSESHVYMTTNGSMRPYEHPNVFLDNASMVVDFGWY